MMAKRFIAVILIISIVLSLSACGTNGNTQTSNDPVVSTETDDKDKKSGEESVKEPNDITTSGAVDVPQKTIESNSVAMLNHIMVITEKIRQSNNSRLYLEEVGNSMLNDFSKNAIDGRTQTQISDLYRLIGKMQLVDVKRERLAYIYEQNRAQALSKALPSPMSLLNVVQSGSKLKAIASVIYLAVDAKSSYDNASYSNEMQYLQDGWELDDEMKSQLDKLNLDAFNYCQDIVRSNNLDGNLTLNQDMAKQLVEWEKLENVERRVEFLENHQSEYKACGYYWLLLSRSYYEKEDYAGCIMAIDKYINSQPQVFVKDVELAKTLPMAIASLSEVKSDNKITKEQQYVELLSSNATAKDWASRYYASLTYIDLYSQSKDRTYLEKAYKEAKTNVNEAVSTSNQSSLLDYQLQNNETYLADVVEKTIPKNATKDEEKAYKDYNKMIKEVRKTELPPVDNALLINVKLMIDLAQELNLSKDELTSIDKIIHNNEEKLFLVDSIDSNLWASKDVKLSQPDITFNGKAISLPANYLCALSSIDVSINGIEVETTTDWVVDTVKRKGDDVEEFIVECSNKDLGKTKYADGDIITISISPYEDYFTPIEVSFKAIKKTIIPGYNFEIVETNDI